MGIKQYWRWNVICLSAAWRCTASHLSWEWRQIIPLAIGSVLTALITFFALNALGTDRSAATDAILSLVITAFVSILVLALVFTWHLLMTPYRMWVASVDTARIQEMKDRRSSAARQLAHELEAHVIEGDRILYPAELSRDEIDDYLELEAESVRHQWEQKAIALVERAGPAEKSMYMTLGGSIHGKNLITHWGFLEPRIKKLRAIMQRQHQIADEP